MFDWENTIAVDTVQENRASSRREGKVSWVFSIAAGSWVIFSSYAGMSIRNWSLFSEVRTPV